jgi:SAM-dependent methyltransferase
MNRVKSRLYDDAFFNQHTEATLLSARVVVPHVLRTVHPRSVVDVGCGLGTWLKVFTEHGAEVIQGMDGRYVDTSKLLISAENFTPVDLVETIRGDLRPVLEKAQGRYDLAVCLEVAEHLPESSAADLVRTLTAFAPVVLFSAAVPGQGGVGHINEQWPSYWKELFEQHGFCRRDPIRPRIWTNERVHWWYRQNIFLFASQQKVAESWVLADGGDKLAPMNELYIKCFNRYRKVRGRCSDLLRLMRKTSQSWRQGRKGLGRNVERYSS